MRAHRAGVGALIALTVAGCGSSTKPKAQPRSDAGIVKAWADAVRDRDYKQAGDLFALPSVLDNGTRVRATRRSEIDVFNRSLPCGAVVTGTAPTGKDRVTATFKLVRGPGGPCDGTAKVTFRIQRGHITEWVRTSAGPPPGSLET